MPPKKAKKSKAVAKKPAKNKPAKAGGKGKAPKANKTKTKNAKRKVANKKRQAKRTQKRRKAKKKTAKKKRKATKAKKKRAKKAKKANKKKKDAKKKSKEKKAPEKKKQQPNSDEEAGGIGGGKFKFKLAGLSLLQMKDLRNRLKVMTKEEFLEQLRNFTEERGKEREMLAAFMGSPEERTKLFIDQEKPTDASAGPFQSNRYGAIFLLPGE